MTPKPKFFKSPAEFRKWLVKNHAQAKEILVGFYKKGLDPSSMTSGQAMDQALCFGWIYGVIKNIDSFTYSIRFTPRKFKSVWSGKNMKRARELKKIGLMHKSGLAALENRDREKSEEKPAQFSARQLKTFKANAKAWSFFISQTKSYQRYMIWWVIAAKKEETQTKRLLMLMGDSANGSKLKRVVDAINKVKKVYPPGQTPIEDAHNIGPVCGAELRSVGIKTIEDLEGAGWEDTFYRLCEMHPHRINLNILIGLMTAAEKQEGPKISPAQKAQAKSFILEMKKNFK